MNNFKLAGVFDEMDVLARAQFLEGYLRIRPFGKIRGSTSKSALLTTISHMMVEAGANSEEWASKHDTGLYRSTFLSVNKAIRSQRGERTTEASDLLQSMMGLSGWENEEGEKLELGGQSPFWTAGKYARAKDSDWLAKGMLPNEAAGLAVKLAFRRALDVLRTERDRARARMENESEIADSTMSGGESDEADWGMVLDTVFGNPTHPVAKKFFDWLYSRIPMIMPKVSGAVMLQYLDILRAGTVSFSGTGQSGAGGGDTAIGKLLGLSPQDLWKAKKAFTTKMAEYIASNPKEQESVQDLFSDASFFRDLFRGSVRASRLRLAAFRVAMRFMEAADTSPFAKRRRSSAFNARPLGSPIGSSDASGFDEIETATKWAVTEAKKNKKEYGST